MKTGTITFIRFPARTNVFTALEWIKERAELYNAKENSKISVDIMSDTIGISTTNKAFIEFLTSITSMRLDEQGQLSFETNQPRRIPQEF